MKTVILRRVTVIAEALLEERLVRDLRRFGSRGHTISDVRGQGSRGVRASEWEGRNVQLETIVSPQVAQALLEYLAATYFEHYAVIAYVQDVEVVRGEKYV
ncbi:hypothetical protein DEDE109153_16075 [Deinococcus deserti]|uniref:Uncharacterized protein n=1 Tax=Deinococcus deserti (strain DSM 17065 / CIP 109153 / LMG 22923 / VCD115) TaxID=546414 RepID=C1CWW6_DEIDV|nr:hypothetical protein [Deinococcus deserti]ACO46683.1 hypothetical protein Deide_17130 [Deinococcus deserti VCD115]